MGVIFDYFRAPDRGVALVITARPGGPLGVMHDALEPPVDGIDAKGYDPFVIIGKLLALVLNQPYEPNLVATELVWPEGDPPATSAEIEALPEDSPWNSGATLEELGTSFRDAFAEVDDFALPWIADQWSRIEELGGLGDASSALDFIEQFVTLARRAKEADDRLYCFCCL